jgi:hypothetical protein
MTAAGDPGQVPPAPLVVITGGEPLMYQDYPALARAHRRPGHLDGDVEIETNGTVPRPDPAALAGCGSTCPRSCTGRCPTTRGDRRIVPAALAGVRRLAQAGRAVFKFVVRTPCDVDRPWPWPTEYGIPPTRCGSCPKGTTPDTVLTHARAVADRPGPGSTSPCAARAAVARHRPGTLMTDRRYHRPGWTRSLDEATPLRHARTPSASPATKDPDPAGACPARTDPRPARRPRAHLQVQFPPASASPGPDRRHRRPVHVVCEHHVLPFTGVATVAYLPQPGARRSLACRSWPGSCRTTPRARRCRNASPTRWSPPDGRPRPARRGLRCPGCPLVHGVARRPDGGVGGDDDRPVRRGAGEATRGGVSSPGHLVTPPWRD